MLSCLVIVPDVNHLSFSAAIEAKDRSMAANIQFHVGDKCFFTIDGRKSSGEIVRLHSQPDQHLVSVLKDVVQLRFDVADTECLGLDVLCLGQDISE